MHEETIQLCSRSDRREGGRVRMEEMIVIVIGAEREREIEHRDMSTDLDERIVSEGDTEEQYDYDGGDRRDGESEDISE